MAVKGAESKNKITQKILETFDGSFLYNDGKEIRIPLLENGETVQIKVTLTAAKVNVSPDGENAIPGANNDVYAQNITDNSMSTVDVVRKLAPTEEEKRNVSDLLKSLGL